MAKADEEHNRNSGKKVYYRRVVNSKRKTWNDKIATIPEELEAPHRWRKPRRVFVDSMSDLWHESIPFDFISKVYTVMNDCPAHVFQVLTKRPHLAAKSAGQLTWTPNIWMGTSVENNSVRDRIAALRSVPAAIRFLSIEPLLGRIPNLPLKGIHWVIVGGESGPGARPMDPAWVREIRDRCVERNVPFFFKQWGGVNKKAAGRTLDGRKWDEGPPLAEGRNTSRG